MARRPAARSLGARSKWDAYAPNAGGFNIGGINDGPPPIQSSVASPNPASVSGQPPMGPGGMRVGQSDDSPGGSTGGVADASTGFSPSVTGFNSSLAGQGLGFATSLAGLPGLGSVTGPLGASLAGPVGGAVGSMLGNTAQSMATNTALGAIPSGLTNSEGQPVGFTNAAPTGLTGSLVAQALGLLGLSPTLAANLLGSMGVPGFTAPSFNTSITNPNNTDATKAEMTIQSPALNGPQGTSSPNMGFSSSPNTGFFGSTFSGIHGVNGVPNVAGTAPGSGTASAAPGMFGGTGQPAGFFGSLFGGSPKCFTAETPVLRADGQLVPIEKIRVGDLVRCYDWTGIKPAVRPVTRISQHEPIGEMVYAINGIKVTGRHKFATGFYQWIHAEKIQPGQVLIGPAGELVTVRTVETSPLTEPVFNLCVGELERTANFIVGDPSGACYLVHNGSGGDGGGGGAGGDGGGGGTGGDGSTGGDAGDAAAAAATGSDAAGESASAAADAAAAAAADSSSDAADADAAAVAGPTGDPGDPGDDPGDDPGLDPGLIGPPPGAPAEDPGFDPGLAPPTSPADPNDPDTVGGRLGFNVTPGPAAVSSNKS